MSLNSSQLNLGGESYGLNALVVVAVAMLERSTIFALRSSALLLNDLRVSSSDIKTDKRNIDYSDRECGSVPFSRAPKKTRSRQVDNIVRNRPAKVSTNDKEKMDCKLFNLLRVIQQ